MQQGAQSGATYGAGGGKSGTGAIRQGASFKDAFGFMNENDIAGLFQPVAPIHDPDVAVNQAAAVGGSGRQAQANPAAGAGTSALQGFAGSSHAPVRGPVAAAQPSRMQLQVSPKQKGNPILQFIRNVSWEYSQALLPEGPDYVMGTGVCALFLALKWHMLKRGYIHKRLKGVRKTDYKLRVLLVQVDVPDCEEPLAELAAMCVANEVTMVCAFTPAEAARYLETYKAYEHKGPQLIQERVEATYLPRAQEALTVVRSINKTDVINLLGHFGSVARAMTASREELAVPPGFGEKKIRRLFEAFHTPFLGPGQGAAGVMDGAGAGAGAASSSGAGLRPSPLPDDDVDEDQ